ncbi:MAG: hypothetical protein DMG79_11345, partial [Acidobacteria bacterium]
DNFRQAQEFLKTAQNSVDSLFTVPQYLVLYGLPTLQVGLIEKQGPRSRDFEQGKIVHTEESFMATKKKAKKKKH